MNTRQLQELRQIVRDGSLSVREAAIRFNLSERTIRYDIDALNAVLFEILGSLAIEIRRNEARLAPGIARWQIEQALPSGNRDYSRNAITPEERTLLIVLELCWYETLRTVQGLADEFAVSRSTIVRDIPAVRAYVEQSNLELETQRGKGMVVKGSEASRRSCLTRVVRDYAQLVGLHSGIEIANYLKWFSAEDISAISDIVFNAEIASGLHLDDTAFEALVIHIALSIERTRSAWDKQGIIPALDDDNPADKTTSMARMILDGVNEALDVDLPACELSYIEMHIMARSGEARKDALPPDPVLEFLCIDFLIDLSRELGVDLTHDAHLFRCLVNHISGSIYRKRFGLVLTNPLFEDLSKNYAEHLALVRKSLITTNLGSLVPMNDDEVSYILLHVEASLVRQVSGESHGANVVVVCSTGYGTAELLAADLQHSFDVNVIACLASHSFHQLVSNRAIDLVVSTVPLNTSLPCVVVHPLLSADDSDRIETRLHELGFGASQRTPNRDGFGELARRITLLVSHNPDTAREETLLKDIMALLKSYTPDKPAPKGEGYMLSELLENGHVALDVEAKDWVDAVRLSGEPLIATGDITSDYVDAVIQNINEVGPYVVITKGVALPHATNKRGVNRTSMSFVRLKRPVEFGAGENDPVEFCFMLACADSTSHIKALTCLASLLMDEGSYDALRHAPSPKVVIDFIEDFEHATEMSAKGGE